MPSRLSQWLGRLASVRLTLLLGGAVCALLAAASWLIPAPRGRGALPFTESFAAFFPVQGEFWWFYGLLLLLGLWFVNGLLGSWWWFLRPVRRDLRGLGLIGMHLGFVLALLAQLAAGLSASVEGSAVLGPNPVELVGHRLRLLDYAPVQNPDGTPRTASASVAVDGRRRALAFNQPLFFELGTLWLSMQGERDTMGPPRFRVSGQRLQVPVGASIEVPGGALTVKAISQHPSLKMPMVSVDLGQGARWLRPGQALGSGVVFEGFQATPGVLVVARRNLGVPLLGVAMLVFALGMAAFELGRWRRRRLLALALLAAGCGGSAPGAAVGEPVASEPVLDQRVVVEGEPQADAAEPVPWPQPGAQLHPPPAPLHPGPPLKLFIDPGHGWKNNHGNTSALCQKEQDTVAELAADLAARLAVRTDITTRLARAKGEQLSYADRLAAAEAWGADLYLCLHSDVRIPDDDWDIRWSPTPGASCLRRDAAPGFAVLWGDEFASAELVVGRRDFARALGAALASSGWPAYRGEDYRGMYREEADLPGVFLDRHAPGRRLFVLRHSSMPAVIVETHHALYVEEARRWAEAPTREAFAQAVAAAVLAMRR